MDIACPSCGKQFIGDSDAIGQQAQCDGCQAVFTVKKTSPSLTEKIDAGIDAKLAQVIDEKQNSVQVRKIYEKVSQLLTSGEKIKYICVQNFLFLKFRPDAVILTDRRFIFYRSLLFGRSNFSDYTWINLHDAKVSEGIFRATLTFHLTNGRFLIMKKMPKEPARKLYAIAQEMEERVAEMQRVRALEHRRAAAGGVVINGTAAAPAGDGSGINPAEKMKQLKDLMDSGLITPGEYEAKRQELLAKI